MSKHFSSVREVKTIQLKTIIVLFLFMLCLICSADKTISATAPLLPFNNTGDLFVLDNGSDNILRITPAKVITIEVAKADILAATGESDVSFNNCGIAFDAAGSMYFAESISDSILKRTTNGTLTVLTSEANIILKTSKLSADLEGIAFGSDGFCMSMMMSPIPC